MHITQQQRDSGPAVFLEDDKRSLMMMMMTLAAMIIGRNTDFQYSRKMNDWQWLEIS
jgi:hypothetical protein